MADLSLRVPLEHKVAIVTGATRGIGRGIAAALVANGAAVVLNGRRADQLEQDVAAMRRAGRRAVAVVGDVGEAATAEALVSAATAAFGRLDILVNNAGLTDTSGDFLTWSEEQIDTVLRINLRGALLCAQRAARQMVTQGSGGAIVNITSVGGSQRAHHRNVVYDVTKGGLDALTRALATDLGPFGIRVNAVGPATTQDAPPEGRGQDLPLRRGGTPEDIAAAVLYFVSDAARFISGQILYADGGLMAQLRSPKP